jgi:pimeloyl-ACP methyl ester carboxylesterase
VIRSERGEKFVLERNGYLAPALQGTTYHAERLTTTVMEAYQAPFPTPASRLALLCWSRDIPIQVSDPSYAEMQQIEQHLAQFARIPILLVWGKGFALRRHSRAMRDPVLGESVLRRWQQTFPHASTQTIADASHFVPEDAPERVVGWIEAFLVSHP